MVGRPKKQIEESESVKGMEEMPKMLTDKDIEWAEAELERLKAEKNKKNFMETAQSRIEELEKVVEAHHKHIKEMMDRINQMFAQQGSRK